MSRRSFRNILCVVPPYQTNGGPPAGIAALMAYLRRAGHDDFEVLDLRPLVPDSYAPTHSSIGVFGETYVTDVPDLPLVLRILRGHETGCREPLIGKIDELYIRYCLERGINPRYLHDYLLGIDRLMGCVVAKIPDVAFIGFSTWTSNYLTTLMAASHLKRRRSPPFIVAGGPQVTQSKAATNLGLMSGLFDVAVTGEGEETLLHLYEAFLNGGGRLTEQVPGTVALDRASGKVVESDRRLLQMSSLPTPDFSRMPLGLYGSPRKLPLQMSRGCTDRCAFCSEWSFWRHYRPDSVARTVEQVEELIGLYGMQQMEFTDSLLNANGVKLRTFAEEVLARSISITWGGLMRAQMDLETARLLKRAGLAITFVGIESMSDETLALMNKRRTEADNIKALEAFLEAGIFVRAGLIPGFPGDTRERFMRTMDSIVRLQKRYPRLLELNVDPFVVNPGSPVFANLSGHGLSPVKWSEDYLDIAPQSLAVTSEVICAVNGPNQGLDRIGALQIVRAVTDVPDKVRFSMGLYNNEDTIAPTHLLFSPVAEGWYLGRLKNPDGQIQGLLLTAAERNDYYRFLSTYSWKPYAILDDEQFASWWMQVDRHHLLGITGRMMEIYPALHCMDLEDAELLWIPTQVVARFVDRKQAKLRLTNVLNEASIVLGGEALPLVTRLAERPRTRREVAALLRSSSIDERQYAGWASVMMVLGIFQVVEHKPMDSVHGAAQSVNVGVEASEMRQSIVCRLPSNDDLKTTVFRRRRATNRCVDPKPST